MQVATHPSTPRNSNTGSPADLVGKPSLKMLHELRAISKFVIQHNTATEIATERALRHTLSKHKQSHSKCVCLITHNKCTLCVVLWCAGVLHVILVVVEHLRLKLPNVVFHIGMQDHEHLSKRIVTEQR